MHRKALKRPDNRRSAHGKDVVVSKLMRDQPSSVARVDDPAVREAMLPFLGDDFANPSSPYTAGRAAMHAIAKARQQCAALIGAQRATS